MPYIKTLLSVAMFGVCASAASQPLAPELIGLLQNHPMIKSVKLSVASAQDSTDAAKSGWFPKLTLSSDVGSEHISSATKTNLQRRRSALLVEQNIFAGMRTVATSDVATLDLELQKNNLNAITQNTLYEGLYAYVQIARYRTLVEIAKRNESTTQHQFNLEDERVQRGGGIAVDVLQAKSRLQIAKEKRVAYEQQLRDAIANYAQVFGHEPDIAIIQSVGVLEGLLPKTLDDALSIAREGNSNLSDSSLSTEKAKKQAILERSNYFPTLDIVGITSEEHNANQVSMRSENSVLLKLNWVLFSGNETGARYSAAVNTTSSLIEREISVKRKVEEQVKQAWNQRTNGLEREYLLTNASNIAYEVMQSRKRLRDMGKDNALNVLDSEVEYFTVLSNKINAAYDARLAAYRLLLAVGQLSPKFLGIDQGNLSALKIPVYPLKIELDVQ